jgi:hypothetical protein
MAAQGGIDQGGAHAQENLGTGPDGDGGAGGNERANRDAYLPNLAASVNNLANRLGEAGRRAEGLAAAQEAARLYGELAAENPDVFGPAVDDAQSLLSALGEDTP